MSYVKPIFVTKDFVTQLDTKYLLNTSFHKFYYDQLIKSTLLKLFAFLSMNISHLYDKPLTINALLNSVLCEVATSFSFHYHGSVLHSLSKLFYLSSFQ